MSFSKVSAAVPIGGDVIEVSRNYFPKDAEYKACPQTDFMLLAVTLMEVHGDLSSPPQAMDSQTIRQKANGIKDSVVREFVLSIIPA